MFQISAYLRGMCLQIAELLVDRRWSSGLSGSGTIARRERLGGILSHYYREAE
ncbi:MAG: hypothetical protein V3T84_02705 [Phycisphaerales bacterium]